MGARFWLGVVGVTIALGVAGFVGFMLLTGFWYRWGFLGMFLIVAAGTLFAGWLFDRRNARGEDAY